MSDFTPALRRLRRRALVRRATIAGVLLVVLVVSALLWPRARPNALSVPTTDRAAAPSGVLAGRMEGRRQGDRVCFRVAAPSGDALLVLPAGWGAGARLDLRDPSGQVVARTGDPVRIVGAPGPVGGVDGCPGTGRIWTVAELQTT